MAAVAITRDEHAEASLRQAAPRCGDDGAARRMLAVALVKEDHTQAEAARLCGMDRQTMRGRVHPYNEAGMAGLADKQGRTGPGPRLSVEQEAEVAGLVRSGPDVAKDGVVRWRRADLARVIGDHFRVRLAERTVGSLLRPLGFVRVSARLRHSRGDIAAQGSFRPGSAPL